MGNCKSCGGVLTEYNEHLSRCKYCGKWYWQEGSVLTEASSEKIYQEALRLQLKGDVNSLAKAAALFQEIPSYKDSESRSRICEQERKHIYPSGRPQSGSNGVEGDGAKAFGSGEGEYGAKPYGSGEGEYGAKPFGSGEGEYGAKPYGSGEGSYASGWEQKKKNVCGLLIVGAVGIFLLILMIVSNSGKKEAVSSSDSTSSRKTSSETSSRENGNGKTGETQGNAWIGDDSGIFGGQVFMINSFSEISIAVNPLESQSISANKAEFRSFSGTISENKQVDEYSFTAPYDGVYRVDVSKLQSGTNVRIEVQDLTEAGFSKQRLCSNNEGVTLNEISAGHSYCIRVKQYSGFSAYELSLGMQKATMDLTGFTQVADSTEFEDQINYYLFTVPVDGLYRFELSNLYGGAQVNLALRNELGEKLGGRQYCSNGDGLTVKKLEAGKTYRLSVEQQNQLSDYVINIGYQKKSHDVDAYSLVKDSVEYEDQENIYYFTAPRDGTYRFWLTGVHSGTQMGLFLYNALEEQVGSRPYCSNGDGFTAKELTEGERYKLVIRQYSDYGSYELRIGRQKAVTEITQYCMVCDGMEFEDQVNRYVFTAQSSGNMKISLQQMSSGVSVNVTVRNELGESVANRNYCSNKEEIKVKNLVAGERYEIEVRENGIGTYTMYLE